MNDRPLSQKWIDFYNEIKDQTWPDLKTQNDFLNLGTDVMREILFDHFLIDYSEARKEKTFASFNTLSQIKVKDNSEYFDEFKDLDFDLFWMTGDIKVFYNQILNGGGTKMSRTFVNMLSAIHPHRVFKNCLEWCSGPGFIGFNIFSKGICKNLYLNDIYLPAINSVKKTIDENINRCRDRVFYHHSKSISDLPKDWKFDLIVANPPFFNPESEQMASKLFLLQPDNRRTVDHQWKIHKDFFNNVKQYLTPEGIILMVEATGASGPDSFKTMIEQNGMYINDCYWEEFTAPGLYYMEIKQIL